MEDDDILTSEGLWQRVADKRATALAMRDSRDHCREAWMAAGSAVEFAIKALIIKREGFNAWPSKTHRPDLHHHNLRRLLMQAGIDLGAVPANIRPSLKVALDWDRHHDYQFAKMPRKQAREMYVSVFGEQGVIEWLRMM